MENLRNEGGAHSHRAEGPPEKSSEKSTPRRGIAGDLNRWRWARRVAGLAGVSIIAFIVIVQSGVLSRGWREKFTAPAEPAAITSREPLTDYIRPIPVFDGGNVIGLRVYAGARSGPFYQMGLTPGDVITAIDGIPVEDLTTSWERLRGLADGAVLTAAVKRDGETLEVTLDGGLIASAEAARAQAPPQAVSGAPIQ